VLFGGLGIALVAGCSAIPHVTHDVITVQSCTANARAVRFTVTYSDPFITTFEVEAHTLNLVGVPTIADFGGYFEVTAELNNVAFGETVMMAFKATALTDAAMAVSDVQFFTVPPDEIVDPGCKAGMSPEFALANQGIHGLVLEASNPAAQPLTLSLLQLVESPNVLLPPLLDWSSPDFNALPWQNAINGSVILDPAGQPLVVDLPDQTAPGTKAVLCRFVSIDGGHELRGIVETDLVSEPVSTQPTTWGAVKALYRTGN
jgi:hypothetical protein